MGKKHFRKVDMKTVDIYIRVTPPVAEKWRGLAEKENKTLTDFIIHRMVENKQARILPGTGTKRYKGNGRVHIKIPVNFKREWELEAKFNNMDLTDLIHAKIGASL